MARPTTAATAATTAKPANPLVTAYLVLYNLACICSWAYVDYVLARHFLYAPAGASLWAAVALPLKIAQTATLLEIAHAALGLVRASAFTTAIQGARRARRHLQLAAA